MRATAVLLLCACATGPHAETFVKRNFGFAGPREITVVGPGNDTNLLRLQLQKRGFRVLEVDRIDTSTTKYVADIGGVCNWGLVGISATDAELHVFVVRAETRERVLSLRLARTDDCPDSFFREAAAELARHWPESQ